MLLVPLNMILSLYSQYVIDVIAYIFFTLCYLVSVDAASKSELFSLVVHVSRMAPPLI